MVMEQTGGRGADLAVEASGSESGINLCIDSLRVGGQMTCLGLTRRESVAARWDAAVRKMLTLRFHMMSDYREMDRAIEIFATYPRDLAPLVTHIAPLDDWERLFDILTRGGGIKGVLNVDGTVRNPV